MHEPVPVEELQPERSRPDRPHDDRLARLLLIPLLGTLAAVLLVFFVFFASYRVVGPSMQPNFVEGDMLLVTRGYDRAIRGDVVIIKGGPDRQNDDLMKRVVAVPGDTIYTSGDLAVVNGVAETGDGLLVGPGDVSVPQTTVPPGSVFVMGDNRPESYDSRYFGLARLDGIRGRVVFRYAPVHRVKSVSNTPGR